MKVTKDNVKVGDKLYIVPDDSRIPAWEFEVGKIGRKWVFDHYGAHKIENGTDEVYRPDGIGCTKRVFCDVQEYKEWKERNEFLDSFDTEVLRHGRFHNMDVDDVSAIAKIMSKYSKRWEKWCNGLTRS